MKKLNVTLSLMMALTIATVAVGCGKNNDQNQATQPVAVVNGAAVPPAAALPTYPNGQLPTNTVPVGCYYNGSSSCSPCPMGYTSNGSYCSYGGTAVQGCSVGTFWNGYYCQQIGYNYYSTGCPWGTTWSWQYYGCVGYGTASASCRYKSYLGGLLNTYVCY